MTNPKMISTLSKIQNAPDLVDQVYRTLLDAISEGQLTPGARLTQEGIAAQLAVSRQPVLQALRLLKKDGFVLDAPGRGVLVAPLDVDWMMHIYQVRSALDSLAARLAAKARFQLAPALISKGRSAARGKNISAMINADAQFHAAIYSASGNPLIAQSAALHWQHIRRTMGAVLQLSSMRESIWDEHAAIAAAIAAGQAALAEKLIREHSEDAARNLARLMTLSASPAEQLAAQN